MTRNFGVPNRSSSEDREMGALAFAFVFGVTPPISIALMLLAYAWMRGWLG